MALETNLDMVATLYEGVVARATYPQQVSVVEYEYRGTVG